MDIDLFIHVGKVTLAMGNDCSGHQLQVADHSMEEGNQYCSDVEDMNMDASEVVAEATEETYNSDESCPPRDKIPPNTAHRDMVLETARDRKRKITQNRYIRH